MLRNLHEQNCEFSAICLQETWLSDSSDISHLLLNNYNFISKGKRISFHSGLGIYLHKKFSYQKVPIEDTSDIWEGQFIEIGGKHFGDKNNYLQYLTKKSRQQLQTIYRSNYTHI